MWNEAVVALLRNLVGELDEYNNKTLAVTVVVLPKNRTRHLPNTSLSEMARLKKHRYKIRPANLSGIQGQEHEVGSCE
jgi:hypothetical protein